MLNDNIEHPTMLGRYIEWRADPNNKELDDSYFCTMNSVSIDSLLLAKSSDKEWARKCVAKRRENYLIRLLEVDDALFMKARTGDIKAVELIYERWEDYVRKKQGDGPQININLAGLIKYANDEFEKRGDSEFTRKVSAGPAII
jgi:hypothetical protein